MSYIKAPETNDVLEECKRKAMAIQDDTAKKWNNKCEQLYKQYKEEIEDCTKIKDFIAKVMSSNSYQQYIKYFRLPSYAKTDHEAWYAMHTEALPDEYFNKLFNTTVYGSVKLLDLLYEKFPPPFDVRYQYNSINIDWTPKNVKDKNSMNMNTFCRDCTLL